MNMDVEASLAMNPPMPTGPSKPAQGGVKGGAKKNK